MLFNLAIDIRLKLDVPPASPYPFLVEVQKREPKKASTRNEGRGGRRVTTCDSIIAIS